MRIADVLRNKGAAVVTINPDATVGELLAGLAEQNIGAMVVVGAEGVVGIVSERDVVRQLHTYGASVLSRPVAKIMSTTVATCTKSDTVDKISVLMTENRVRHWEPHLADGFSALLPARCIHRIEQALLGVGLGAGVRRAICRAVLYELVVECRHLCADVLVDLGV